MASVYLVHWHEAEARDRAARLRRAGHAVRVGWSQDGQPGRELRKELPDAPSTLTSEAVERLLGYGWPGNIREMRNVLERAMILGRGQPAISVEHLPGEFRARPGIGDRRHTPLSLDDLERQHIERTLKHHGGNRTRAAQELGISRATLINKIKRYAIHA